MPRYDAFGRPLEGELTLERARAVPRAALVAVALCAVAIAAAALIPRLDLSSDEPARRVTAKPAQTAAPPAGEALPTRNAFGSDSLLHAANFERAFRAGMKRADRYRHGALVGVTVAPESIDLQFTGVHGRARDVFVRGDGTLFSNTYKSGDYGHHFTAEDVDFGAPERFVPAAAKALNKPVDALLTLGALEVDDAVMWFATFKGYHGDVRGDPHGAVLEKHPYP
jgi:hypothetical protein